MTSIAIALQSANPPSYEALRTRTSIYVEYMDGAREFYDLAATGSSWTTWGDNFLDARGRSCTDNCGGCHLHGALACWSAGHPTLVFG